MDLTTNGVVITDAIKYVQGQIDHLSSQEKNLLQDIKQKKEKPNEESAQDEEPEVQKTHNRVF
jgi:hypothetical protein